MCSANSPQSTLKLDFDIQSLHFGLRVVLEESSWIVQDGKCLSSGHHGCANYISSPADCETL